MLSCENIALITIRQTRRDEIGTFLVGQGLINKDAVSIFDIATVFPLYLYPGRGASKRSRQTMMFDGGVNTAPDGRHPNLSDSFITELAQRLALRFIPDERGDLQETIGPEDVFHYAYAVFHSPTYRSRYAEFLKIDFPRLPLTSDVSLFAALAEKGAELVDLHLLRLPGDDGVGGNGGATILVSPGKQGVTFPKPGTGVVEKVAYVGPQGSHLGRIGINNEQYFEGIEPETWEMHIGGYQPLDKWLKDRKGRALSFEDIQHYLRIVIALRETRRIMAEIDELIPGWPLV